MHGSDVNPGFGARDRSLEILCQAAVPIEPSKGSLNDPSARQQLKADGVSGGFDDFDGPVTEFGEGITQTGAIIDAVGEEMTQPGKQLVDGRDDQSGTSRSWTSAGCTSAPTSRPQVSVTM